MKKYLSTSIIVLLLYSVFFLLIHYTSILDVQDDYYGFGAVVRAGIMLFGILCICTLFAIYQGYKNSSFLVGLKHFFVVFFTLGILIYGGIVLGEVKSRHDYAILEAQEYSRKIKDKRYPIVIVMPKFAVYSTPVYSPIDIEIYVHPEKYNEDILPLELISNDDSIFQSGTLIFSGDYSKDGRKIFRGKLSFDMPYDTKIVGIAGKIKIPVYDKVEKIYNGSSKFIGDSIEVTFMR